jgi:hypothetical protein
VVVAICLFEAPGPPASPFEAEGHCAWGIGVRVHRPFEAHGPRASPFEVMGPRAQWVDRPSGEGHPAAQHSWDFAAQGCWDFAMASALVGTWVEALAGN